ncbi:MAG: serine hydrolase, partial [Gemmatimonadota bacterium]|nr:serine hydrolase [Gemmatimonadota bacterium]
MPDMTIQDQIDAIIENAINETQLVGASVGVMRDNEVVLARGYGYADLNNKAEATEHTVYRIGSITKQFTALAIMILVEQGKVNLNDIMLDYLSNYPQRAHKVTIDQLLNHTSGIKSYTDIERFWEISERDLSRQEVVGLFSSEPIEFSPDENFQYNNSGYYLLGLIIENVSGMSYADFLKANVWQPLEMFDTHYLGKTKPIKNLATGYDHKDNEFVLARPIGMDNPFSGGSLGSSILDLLKWQTALNENQLISRQSYNKMIEPGLLRNGKHTTYGYGFFMSNLNGHRKIEHGGTINGFRAQLSAYPDDDLTVTVLCNLNSA